MDDQNGQRQFALAIIEQAKPKELVAIQSWAEGLLDIKKNETSRFAKARAAIALTLASKVVWPVVKLAARRAKQIGWDNRSGAARLGLLGSSAGLALFGGQSAGIAALGTAIGVPLWIVLGAGSAFAGGLISEIKRVRSTESDQDQP